MIGGSTGLQQAAVSGSPERCTILEVFEPAATETATWWDGKCQLEIAAAVTDEEPDWAEVSNVRALIVDGTQVVLARSREGVLHLPGGRLEPREVPQAALARELREELGITSHLAERIGRIRFRHLTPKPHDYPYPFPVFEQVVYLVTAPSFDASHQIEDDWIADVIRMPMSQLEEADLPPTHRVFIDWLAMRQTSSITPAVESVEPIKE